MAAFPLWSLYQNPIAMIAMHMQVACNAVVALHNAPLCLFNCSGPCLTSPASDLCDDSRKKYIQRIMGARLYVRQTRRKITYNPYNYGTEDLAY